MAFVRTRSIQTRDIGSSNVLTRAVGDAYAVDGFEPELAFDFTGETYRTDGSATTFSGAMTHAATSLGTMVDGYGPELVKNGTFDTDLRSWTDNSDAGGIVQFDSGSIKLDSNSGTARAYQSFETTVGKTYIITADAVLTQNGTDFLRVGNGITSQSLVGLDITGTGSYSAIFVSTHTTLYVNFFSSSGVVNFDNISIREVPAIKWRPHNLLTYSEDFTNADWTATSTTVTSDQSTAPDGTFSADLLDLTAATDARVAQTVATPASGAGQYTFKVWVKSVSGSGDFRIGLITSGGTTNTSVAAITDSEWTLMEVSHNYDASNNLIAYPAYYINGASYIENVYIWGAHLYRSDLGGMVDNPDRGDSYVPTAVRVLPSAPELVTNGHFNTNVIGWTAQTATISWDASGALSSTTSGYAQGAYQNITTTIGKTYIVTASSTSASILHRLRINAGSYAGTILVESAEVSTPTTFTLTFTATSTTTTVYLRSSAAGTVLWDNISIKESYVDPSVARYLPRRGHYVYNDQAWTNRGLLLESEARTNLLTYSNGFSGQWALTNVVDTANSIASPDGTSNAFYAVADSTPSSFHRFTSSCSIAQSTTYTFSTYLKAGGYTLGGLSFYDGVAYQARTLFDLSDGTINSTVEGSATIEDVGNGWYRCSITGTTDAAASASGTVYISVNSLYGYAGDDASGIYSYGAQLEAGSTPSSYIPTNGGTLTRAAETLTVAAADLPSTITPIVRRAALVTAGWTITDGGAV